MNERPFPDNSRIRAILERTAGIIPVLRMHTLSRKQADQFLTEESRVRAETVDRLRNILLPYEASLHARLYDIFGRPEDILLQESTSSVQFAIPSRKNGYLTFINFETQKQNVRGKDFRFLKHATFCESPTDTVKIARKHFISLKFSRVFGFEFDNAPGVFTEAVSFNFNRKGRIRYIAVFDPHSILNNTQRHVYFLDNNSFRVKSGSYYHSLSSDLQPKLSEVAYNLCTDGKFRKAEKTSKTNMSIEEEIAAVLARLPFVDYQLPTPSNQ